jgi:lipid II:glycine glycyltransferase (peptidoglycan interpeptide bridge formation enzyme)
MHNTQTRTYGTESKGHQYMHGPSVLTKPAKTSLRHRLHAGVNAGGAAKRNDASSHGAPSSAAGAVPGVYGIGLGAVGSVDVELSREPLDSDWDAFVDATPGGHQLQTSMWGRVKATEGWRPVRLRAWRDGELVGGAQLLVWPTRLGAIGYCPRGPLLHKDDHDTLWALLDALAKVARSDRILYLKVQPPAGREHMEPVLRELGFVAGDMQAAPIATVRIDLRRPAEEILASMRSATRQKIRKATRKGIVVREAGASGLAAFGDVLAATGRRQGFAPYPVEYYAEILRQFGDGHRAGLLLAEYDGEVLSGAVIVGYGDTVVYKMGGWSGDSTGPRPNELMHWQAMQWAKERGYRYYDFDGISPTVARAALAGEELPEAGHSGPTFFKLGFGGEVALYPPTYDRSYHPLLALPARIAAPRLNHFQALAHRLQGRVPIKGGD